MNTLFRSTLVAAAILFAQGSWAHDPAEHAKEAAAAKTLLKYPEDSAGGIMNDRFITLRSHQTVGEGHKRIRQKHREQKRSDINYLFVTDKEKKLVGVVSIRDLIFSDDEVNIIRVGEGDPTPFE